MKGSAGRSAVVLALVALSACRGDRWVIGTPLDEPGDAGLALDAAALPRCGATDGEPEPEPGGTLPSADQVGRWRAQVTGEEATKFSSLGLELTLAADGVGRLRFESARTPEPALDGARGYLCSAPSAATCAPASGFVPGFTYTLPHVWARGGILSFRSLLDEPWEGWCALQTPLEQTVSGCPAQYGIEPAYVSVSWGEACAVLRADGWFDIDCGRLATVERRPCSCTALGCRAASNRVLDAHLRLVAPGVLEGALWFERERALVVQFERIADAQ